MGLLATPAFACAADGEHLDVPLWTGLPFGLLLLAIAVCPWRPVLAPQPQQDPSSGGLRDPGGPVPALHSRRLDCLAPHTERIRLLYHPARLALYDLRRHCAARRHPGPAAHEHRLPGRGRGPCQLDRDDGGQHAPDPARSPGEPGATADASPASLLHLLGEQPGRAAHSPGRPAPLSRLPQGCGLFLDAVSLARMARGKRSRPHDLPDMGYAGLPPGNRAGPEPGHQTDRTPADPRARQSRLPSRRGPGRAAPVGGSEPVPWGGGWRPVRLPGPHANPALGRDGDAGDGRALAPVYAAWAAEDEWLRLGSDRRSGGVVRGDIRDHGARAGLAGAARAGARHPRTLAVFLADRQPLVVPGQRPDLPNVRHPGGRAKRFRLAPGETAAPPPGDQLRRGFHGGQHVHRKRAKLYGEGPRRRGRHPDAVFLRLRALLRHHPAAGVPARNLALLFGPGRCSRRLAEG